MTVDQFEKILRKYDGNLPIYFMVSGDDDNTFHLLEITESITTDDYLDSKSDGIFILVGNL